MSKRLLPSDEEVVRLYTEDRKSIKEICRMFGLSEGSASNVSKLLRAKSVEIRKDAGENHHAWKGGKINKGDGYVGIWNPQHERADSQGYVFEHTLVIERETGMLPHKDEVVHHINLDKTDNRIENLWVCGNKEHLVCHRSIEKLIKPLIESKIVMFNNGKYEMNSDVLEKIFEEMC